MRTRVHNYQAKEPHTVRSTPNTHKEPLSGVSAPRRTPVLAKHPSPSEAPYRNPKNPKGSSKNPEEPLFLRVLLMYLVKNIMNYIIVYHTIRTKWKH